MSLTAVLGPEARMARLASFRAWWYWWGTAAWTIWFVLPLGLGWLYSLIFGQLQRDGASTRFWLVLGSFLVANLGSALFIRIGHRVYMEGAEAAKGLARVNVVRAQLTSGGAGAGPRSVPVGDAVARLRDEPFDILFLLDNWVDLLGFVLYGIGAVVLLARIDPWATAAGVVPMVAIGLANRMVGNVARRFRARARQAAGSVGDFLTAAVSASLTVKVAGAQRDVLARLDTLNDHRARTAVLDQTWNEVLWSSNSAVADLFVGTALVVAARRGLDAQQITLFAGYLASLVWVPMRLSAVIVGRRRYEVSAGRLDALLPPRGAGPDRLVEHHDLPILGGPPAARPTLAPRRPLARLEVSGLTVASRRLVEVDLSVGRGELVVVSGPVGSGKTSLLRAVVGLLAVEEGIVAWNGEAVEDRAAFFVPPQCAFVAQVPRLFAATLADNIRLGHRLSDDDVAAAIELAAFDDDVAGLPDGLETPIGARGVRLSGGQAQRAAAARALAHRPELLVLDDLTSALDVETERLLWDRLAAAGFTVLAASNRPVALARADHVVRLGRRQRGPG